MARVPSFDLHFQPAVEIRVDFVRMRQGDRVWWEPRLAEGSPVNEIPPEMAQRIPLWIEQYERSGYGIPSFVGSFGQQRIDDLMVLTPHSTLDVDWEWRQQLADPNASPAALLATLDKVPDRQLGAALAMIPQLPHWPFLSFEAPDLAEEIRSGKPRQRWHDWQIERLRARRIAEDAQLRDEMGLRLKFANMMAPHLIDHDQLREQLGIPRAP